MKRYIYRRKRGLYRSRDGIIMGVCRGLGDYFDFSVFWIRAIVVLFLFLTGFWPVLAVYIIAWLIMKPEPMLPGRSMEGQGYYRNAERNVF